MIMSYGCVGGDIYYNLFWIPVNFFSFSFSLRDSKQYFVVSPLVLFYNMYFFMEQISWRDNIGFSTLDTIPFLGIL